MIDDGWGAFRPAWSVINRMCADCPRRCQRSKGGHWPSEDIKADPGAGVPAISGGEAYSGATLDGGRRCDTSRLSGSETVVLCCSVSRRTAAVRRAITSSTPRTAVRSPTSTRSPTSMGVVRS